VKTRRNISRIAAEVTFSQYPWGGKLGGQKGPRGFIGERQPTDELAVGEPDPLFGVDLPDLMGFCGAGNLRGLRPWWAWAIDPRPDKGLLEGPD
jgi:hypothetical protein